MTYRRKWGTCLWHSSSQCSKWPAEMLAEERPTLPANAVECAECEALDLLPPEIESTFRAAG
jgi:hypothetical protein